MDDVTNPSPDGLPRISTGNEQPPPPPMPGLEGFRLLDKIGEGGMGAVWRALQLSTSRVVALKLLSPATFGSDTARARFQREVALSARLEHPHIARVYDSGLRQGIYFYAMELVKGLPLDEHIQKYKCSQDFVLQLMEAVCRAVDYAHGQGIIHTDLKPSNIMVTSDGQPRLLDFGLAKSTWGDEAMPKVSFTGLVAGTPGYMSPEQAAGERSTLDARTDVYALGVILFQILTGDFPHDRRGTWHAVARRVIEEEPRRPREVNPALDWRLEAILLRALARDRNQRYATATALAQDIANYRQQMHIAAPPPPPPPPPPPTPLPPPPPPPATPVASHVVEHRGRIEVGAPTPCAEQPIWEGRASFWYFLPKMIGSVIWICIWIVLAMNAAGHAEWLWTQATKDSTSDLQSARATWQQCIRYAPWMYYFFVFLNVKSIVYRLIEYFNIRYTFTTQRIKIREGIFNIRIQQMELFRLKDIEVRQSFWGRLCGYAHFTLVSADRIVQEGGISGRKNLAGIPGGDKLADTVRHAAQHARASTGIVSISE